MHLNCVLPVAVRLTLTEACGFFAIEASQSKYSNRLQPKNLAIFSTVLLNLNSMIHINL